MKTKKILSVVIAMIMVISVIAINTVSVSAADPQIVAEFKASAGSVHDKDGAKKDGDNMVVPSAYNDHVYGYNVEGAKLVGGNIYKVAFYMTIDNVDDTDLTKTLKVNPGFVANNIYSGASNAGQLWSDTSFSVLKDNVGKKVIVVGAFSTGKDIANFEGRLWKTDGVAVTIHKVAIAENGYDFGKDAEYKLISETTDETRDFTAANKVVYSTGMSKPDSIKDNKGLKATVYSIKDNTDAGKAAFVAAVSANKGNGGDFVLDDTKGNFAYGKENLFKLLQVVEGMDNVTAVPKFDNLSNSVVEYNAIVWSGYIVPKEDGNYKILGRNIDNVAAMFIDDNMVFEFWQGNVWEDKAEVTIDGQTVAMEAGKAYKFTLYFAEEQGGEAWDFAAQINDSEAINFDTLFDFYTVNPTTGEEHTPVVTDPVDPNPNTGDVTAVGAILVAGIAGFAGLKLKRKSK